MERDYYVYKHVRKSDGKVVYIGKGKGQRAWNKNRSVREHESLLKSDGISVHLIKQHLSDSEALQEERYQIALHKLALSPLYNLTDGGDGGDT